jgi:acyl-coenzyme A synthetase/AMP-(fatty) acid ligase
LQSVWPKATLTVPEIWRGWPCLRAIAFVDALPKAETGKLQRFKLRQQQIARAKTRAS